MKRIISLSTGSIFQFGIHRIFRIAKAAGFKQVELMMRGDAEKGHRDTFDASYLKSLEHEFDIKIHSLHSPIDFEMKPEAYYDKVVLLAGELSVSQIIFHMPRKNCHQTGYKQWFKDIYPEKLKHAKILHLTENMGRKCIKQGVGDFSKFPHLCFDTTHELKAGTDIENITKGLSNISQFHISDFDKDLTHVGLSANKNLITRILKLHPSADFCLELSPNAFIDPLDEDCIIETLTEQRKYLENI
jgi:sugar phosphate isomerase/epimerase